MAVCFAKAGPLCVVHAQCNTGCMGDSICFPLCIWSAWHAPCSVCIWPNWIWQDIYHGQCLHSWRQYARCHSKGYGQYFSAHQLQQGCRVYGQSGLCRDPQGTDPFVSLSEILYLDPADHKLLFAACHGQLMTQCGNCSFVTQHALCNMHFMLQLHIDKHSHKNKQFKKSLHTCCRRT